MSTATRRDNQRRSFLGRLLAGVIGALAAPGFVTTLRAAVAPEPHHRNVRVRPHPDAVARTNPRPRKHV